jgi:hypothetical protein
VARLLVVIEAAQRRLKGILSEELECRVFVRIEEEETLERRFQ